MTDHYSNLNFYFRYESSMKILQKVPHVYVFSNEHPDDTKLSADRMVVTMIHDNRFNVIEPPHTIRT